MQLIMIHLDFILWMTLFPISFSLCSYIDAMKYKVKGHQKIFSEETEGYSAMVIVFIYLFVGFNLF